MNKKVSFAIRIAVSYLTILAGFALNVPKQVIIFTVIWCALSDIYHLFVED